MCCSLQADKDTDFPEVFIVPFEIRREKRKCFEEYSPCASGTGHRRGVADIYTNLHSTAVKCYLHTKERRKEIIIKNCFVMEG